MGLFGGMFDGAPEMSGLEGLQRFAEMLGGEGGPMSREDIERKLGATKETKRPAHLMVELQLAKLQAGEEVGMAKTERMLMAFFQQEEGLAKEIENLKKVNNELEVTLREDSEKYRTLFEKGQHLEDVLNDRDAEIEKQCEQIIRLQKSVEAKETVLRQRAGQSKEVQVERDNLNGIIQAVMSAVDELDKEPKKLALEKVVKNIQTVLATLTPVTEDVRVG